MSTNWLFGTIFPSVVGWSMKDFPQFVTENFHTIIADALKLDPSPWESHPFGWDLVLIEKQEVVLRQMFEKNYLMRASTNLSTASRSSWGEGVESMRTSNHTTLSAVHDSTK